MFYMYAIFQTGGKQYRVQPQDVIDVELLKQPSGAQVEFKEVLFFHDDTQARVGVPYVEGCTVRAELVDTVAGEKVVIFKFKRRKNARRKTGHRQKYSRLRILDIAH
jgi:large subunit ribosomal protein L21